MPVPDLPSTQMMKMMIGSTDSASPELWGCSVRGPSHVREKLPNQDAWLVRRYSWGAVVVVADGLGSCRYSQAGSRAACRAVAYAARHCHLCGDFSPGRLIPLVHERWISLLAGRAARDCATTALFAIRHREKLLLGRLGDGMIAAAAHNPQNDVLLSDVKTGTYANMTACLRGAIPASEWEIVELSAVDYTHVLLCTDGIADDLEAGQHVPFARALLSAYAPLPRAVAYRDLRASLLRWPRPGHTDDKTLAIMNLNANSSLK